MYTYTRRGIDVISDFPMESEEVEAYTERGLEKYPNLREVRVSQDREDPDFVNLDYTLAGKKFDRIRRITGYLVGTLDRFNDAKRAEEADRVTHSVPVR